MNSPSENTSPGDEKPIRIVEGWLNVWEVPRNMESLVFAEGKTPMPIWEPHLCVLIETNRTLSHFRTEKAAQDCRWFAISGSPPMISLPGDPGAKPSAIVSRVGGSKEDFDRAWGYRPTGPVMEEMLVHSPLATLAACSKFQTMDNRSISKNEGDGDHVSERRGSCSSLGSNDDTSSNNMKQTTHNRFMSFFSRKTYLLPSNLKRTKSATKLDPKKNSVTGIPADPASTTNAGDDKGMPSPLKRSMSVGRLSRRFLQRPGTNSAAITGGVQKGKGKDSKSEKILLRSQSKLHASHSHESLLNTSAGLHSISLSPDGAEHVSLRRLHSSILSKDFCFQLSTSDGTKFYSCRSADELNKWMQHLNDCIHPALDNIHRRENSLHLWILEAKNLNPKKKYFCEVCLDKVTYGRTSAKLMADMLFWGEQFEFLNLASLETLTVNLYREAEKKKKKEKHILIGTVNIPINSVSSRHVVERWYKIDVSAAGRGSSKDTSRGSDAVSIRVKARYQAVDIFPVHCYTPLVEYILSEYSPLVEALEPSVSVKLKEELATSLVAIFQHFSRAQNFLSDTVISEVDRLDNETLALRGNSIATKAVEAYMKLIGQKYLLDTLGDVIRTLLEPSTDVEVDPTKVASTSTLKENQQSLIKFCEVVWYKIVNTHQYFPIELKELFTSIRQRYQSQRSPTVCDQLISSCVFLRFFCPAILSPSLFHLTQEYPSERGARNVTLVAKTIQGLANFTKFGGKEEFMTFMNDFVSREFTNMDSFLKQISTLSTARNVNRYDNHIDVGKHLAIFYSLLKECLQDLNESSKEKLGQLCSILDNIAALSNECRNVDQSKFMQKSTGTNYAATPTGPDYYARHINSYPRSTSHNTSGDSRSLVGESRHNNQSESLYSSRSAATLCVTGTPTTNGAAAIALQRSIDLYKEQSMGESLRDQSADKSRLGHALSFDSSSQSFIHGHGQLSGIPSNSVLSPPQVSDSRHQVSDSRHQISDSRHHISDSIHQISDSRHQVSDSRGNSQISSYTLPYSSRHAAHYHSTDSRLLLKTPDAQAAPVDLSAWSDSSHPHHGANPDLDLSTRTSARSRRPDEDSVDRQWKKILDVASSDQPGLVQFSDETTYQRGGTNYTDPSVGVERNLQHVDTRYIGFTGYQSNNPASIPYQSSEQSGRRDAPTAGHYSPAPVVRSQTMQTKALSFSNPVYRAGMPANSMFSVSSSSDKNSVDLVSIGSESNRSNYNKSIEDIRATDGMGSAKNLPESDKENSRNKWSGSATNGTRHDTKGSSQIYRSEIDRNVANYRSDRPETYHGASEARMPHSKTMPEFKPENFSSRDQTQQKSDARFRRKQDSGSGKDLSLFTKANPCYLSNSTESLSRLGWEGSAASEQGMWSGFKQRSPVMSRSTPRVDCIGADDGASNSWQGAGLHSKEPLSKSSDFAAAVQNKSTQPSYTSTTRITSALPQSSRTGPRASDIIKSNTAEVSTGNQSYQSNAASRHRRSDLAYRQTMSLESQGDDLRIAPKSSQDTDLSRSVPNSAPLRSPAEPHWQNNQQQTRLLQQMQLLQLQYQQKQQRMQDQQLHQVQLREGQPYESRGSIENGNNGGNNSLNNIRLPVDNRPPRRRPEPNRSHDKNRVSMPVVTGSNPHWAPDTQTSASDWSDSRLASSVIHNSLPELGDGRSAGVPGSMNEDSSVREDERGALSQSADDSSAINTLYELSQRELSQLYKTTSC